MFENLRQINTSAISNMRGLIDPSNLAQFNQFEGGYSIFSVVSIPKILEALATSTAEILDSSGNKTGVQFTTRYKNLIATYIKILEQEFRGISGLDDITTETGEFTNGLTQINMINKVIEQSAGTFAMTYTEKAGAPITRATELLLKAIKDTRTGFKHYHGLIEAGDFDLNEVGFQSECFSFLYIITDNTGLRVERSYFIVGAQPTTAQLNDLYNSEKGNYDFKEISCEFTGVPLTGSDIDAKAVKYLEYLTGVHVDPSTNRASRINAGTYTLDSTRFTGYKGADSDSDLTKIAESANGNASKGWRNKILGE